MPFETGLILTTTDGHQVVPSLGSLASMTPSVQAALGEIGITTIHALLHYQPIHDARLLLLLASGKLLYDFGVADLLDGAQTDVSPDRIPSLKVEVLRGIGAQRAQIWNEQLGVELVSDLARFQPFLDALSLVEAREEELEPPSAPRDLMPKAVGSIASSSNFSGFVRDAELNLRDMSGLQLRVLDSYLPQVDPSLLSMFLIEPKARIQLGYSVLYKQSWVNMGTHLGEPIKSIGLIPGEVRRLAIIDWQRRLQARRDESTTVEEHLSNEIIQKRALDEVTRATAVEHQSGGTNMNAATVAGAMGGVVGGAVVGAATVGIPAAAIGAIAGAPAGGIGAAPGAIIGLAAGGIAGGIGGAVVAAANVQWGQVEADTQGDREIVVDMAQRIADTTAQKASNIRSLWSTVVVADEQSESAEARSVVIANYNHAHALTIQYFEVLQHYQMQMKLQGFEPLLFLPFKPIEFTFPLIKAYWPALRSSFSAPLRHRYDRAVERFSPILVEAAPSAADIDAIRVVKATLVLDLTVNNTGFGLAGGPANMILAQPSLLHQGTAGLVDTDFERAGQEFSFAPVSGETVRLRDIHGLRIMTAASGMGMTSHQSGNGLLELLVEHEDGRQWILRQEFDVDGPMIATVTFTGPTLAEKLQAGGSEQDHELLETLVALKGAINSRRYHFTRQLLLGIEPAQISDIVEGLVFCRPDASPLVSLLGPAANLGSKASLAGSLTGVLNLAALQQLTVTDGIPLSAFVDTTPLAITDDMIVFRMKNLRVEGAATNVLGSANQALKQRIKKDFAELEVLRSYPEELNAALSPRKRETLAGDSIYLPTAGVFAEAILGRSISAEKVDGTRNIFWDELSIPHLPTEILPVSLDSRFQQSEGLDPTVPDSVLEQSEGKPLPLPQTVAGALAALNNGSLFRDMSKTEALAGVMSNLSQLAAQQGQLAGQLAGEAQQQAMQSATALASKVADLSASLISATAKAPPPSTGTQRAVALNEVDKEERKARRRSQSDPPVPKTPPLPDPKPEILGIAPSDQPLSPTALRLEARSIEGLLMACDIRIVLTQYGKVVADIAARTGEEWGAIGVFEDLVSIEGDIPLDVQVLVTPILQGDITGTAAGTTRIERMPTAPRSLLVSTRLAYSTQKVTTTDAWQATTTVLESNFEEETESTDFDISATGNGQLTGGATVPLRKWLAANVSAALEAGGNILFKTTSSKKESETGSETNVGADSHSATRAFEVKFATGALEVAVSVL